MFSLRVCSGGSVREDACLAGMVDGAQRDLSHACVSHSSSRLACSRLASSRLACSRLASSRLACSRLACSVACSRFGWHGRRRPAGSGPCVRFPLLFPLKPSACPARTHTTRMQQRRSSNCRFTVLRGHGIEGGCALQLRAGVPL
jgi:hypothetical protein